MARTFIDALPIASWSIQPTIEYQPINPNGIRLASTIYLTNNSSHIVMISFDGDTDHEIMLPHSSKEVPGIWKSRTIVYARSKGDTGSVFMSSYYVD